jgi:hypothetical protein
MLCFRIKELGADRRIFTLGVRCCRSRQASARKAPPVSDKDSSVGAMASSVKTASCGASLRMTVMVRTPRSREFSVFFGFVMISEKRKDAEGHEPSASSFSVFRPWIVGGAAGLCCFRPSRSSSPPRPPCSPPPPPPPIREGGFRVAVAANSFARARRPRDQKTVMPTSTWLRSRSPPCDSLANSLTRRYCASSPSSELN